jgi:tungstate transport system permease protein
VETIVRGLWRGLGLLVSGEPELWRIVLLSLEVSGTAILLAALVGCPLGAAVALSRFPGRRMIINLLNTFMGLPPVVVGLTVYLILSRSGPLGALGLLFSPSAMIAAQTVLALPIVAALSVAAVAEVSPLVREAALGVGASNLQATLVVVREARFALMAALIAGFGRVIAEVGAVLMVGGNIAGYTRVMTTAIALDTARGDFELAIGLGLFLIGLSFVLNLGLQAVQGSGRRR